MRINTRDLALSGRKKLKSGFLVVDSVIARTGIQEYKTGDGNTVRMYRPPDEVFDSDSIDSFFGAPVTNDHPSDDVTVDNWRDLAVGEVIGITTDSKKGVINAKIIIRDKKAIKDIEDGKAELSCGYSADVDYTDGVTPEGEAYDAVQRGIRGNHVAIVDKGRCGGQCRILDEDKYEVDDMADVVTSRTIIVDGVSWDVPTNVGSLVETLSKVRDELTAKLATAEGKLPEIEFGGKKLIGKDIIDALAGKDAEIKTLQGKVIPEDKIHAIADELVSVRSAGERLTPELDLKGLSVSDAKKAIVNAAGKLHEKVASITKAITGGQAVNDADDVTVGRVFAALDVMDLGKKPKGRDKIADSLRNAGFTDSDKNDEPEIDARVVFANNTTGNGGDE